MSTLFQAVNNQTTTTNGMDAYKSTLSPLVDLFVQIGTNRGVDMSNLFFNALKADEDKALRMLLWSRDVRGGAGERDRFRDLLRASAQVLDKDTLIKVLNKIPEVGRFDDLHIFVGTDFENIALQIHADAIKAGNGLAAKWAPRKGEVAIKLRNILELSPKGYRKTIVSLTNVVEQKMCAKEWGDINYSHIPSQASRIYAKAFSRHDALRYSDYLSAVMTGEAKMNAAAVFPHEILRSCGYQPGQADAQWKSLPNYLEGVDERILCVCDVSGSMYGTPMEISVALGLYFSERMEGLFKNQVVTFSDNPNFVTLSGGTLSKRVRELKDIAWGNTTNFEAVFDKLLKTAVRHNLDASELPTKIVCMTDMQFNEASKGGTAFEMIEQKYKDAGYPMPLLVFWNIGGTNVPATFDQKNVAIVSGSSPSTIKAVLGGDIDPVKVMLNAIMKDRYSLK